jgi:hypothetical protein
MTKCMSTEVAKSGGMSIGDVIGLIGGLAGLIGGIVSVLAWMEARESRKIAAEAQVLSQRTYDRAAGKVTAKLAVEAVSPAYEQISQRFKFRSPLGTDEVRVTSLEQLHSLSPRITVKNVGDEAIEGIRVETKLVLAAFPGAGPTPDKQWATISPWTLLKESEQEDFTPSKKLLPGQTTTVPFLRGLVAQMIQAQAIDHTPNDHYGRIEIKYYGRLVGATSYDEGVRGATILMKFVWAPEGFSDEKCKAFLEGSRPAVGTTEKE